MIKKQPWVLNKTVLPQHTDHAGVMWHGAYLNWLEESRIKALNESGLYYSELLNNNFELPVSMLTIKYKVPIRLNDEININSYFEISKSPKIVIHSQFLDKNKIVSTEAIINLVLISKTDFSIIKRRPQFIDEAFKKLLIGPK